MSHRSKQMTEYAHLHGVDHYDMVSFPISSNSCAHSVVIDVAVGSSGSVGRHHPSMNGGSPLQMGWS